MAEPKLHQRVDEVEEKEKRDHKAPRWDREKRGQQHCWGHGGGVGWGGRTGREERRRNAQGRKWGKEGGQGEGQRVGCRGMGVGMPGGPRNDRIKRECGTWADCTCQEGGENAKVTGGLPGGGTGAGVRTGETDGQRSRGQVPRPGE